MNQKLLTLISPMVFFLCGCSSCPPPPEKSLVKSPDTVYNFFSESIKHKDYDDAYQVLSPATKESVQYEEFYLAFTNFFALVRIVNGAKVEVSVNEGEKTGEITLTNNDFGFSERFKIRYISMGQETGYWVIELSREKIDELLALAKKWYQFQLANLGERKYSIPYWWRYEKFNNVEEGK